MMTPCETIKIGRGPSVVSSLVSSLFDEELYSIVRQLMISVNVVDNVIFNRRYKQTSCGNGILVE